MIERGSGTDGVPRIVTKVIVGIGAGEGEVFGVGRVQEGKPEVPGRFGGDVGPAGDAVGGADCSDISELDSAEDVSHLCAECPDSVLEDGLRGSLPSESDSVGAEGSGRSSSLLSESLSETGASGGGGGAGAGIGAGGPDRSISTVL